MAGDEAAPISMAEQQRIEREWSRVVADRALMLNERGAGPLRPFVRDIALA